MFKRNKVEILGLLLITFIVSFIMIYISYNKPADINVSKIENVNQLSIEELLTEFNGNLEKANATFIEKVIEVEGVIKEVSYLNNRHTIILKSKSFTQSFVICDMSPKSNDRTNEFVVGNTIVLRGVCKGYLLDVIMLNCMPTNE